MTNLKTEQNDIKSVESNNSQSNTINSYTQGEQKAPNAVLSKDGNSVLISYVSEGQDGSGYGVILQKRDLNGNPITFANGKNEIIVNAQTEGDQGWINNVHNTKPAIGVLENGKIVIAYSVSTGNGNSKVVMRLIDEVTGQMSDEKEVSSQNKPLNGFVNIAVGKNSFAITYESGNGTNAGSPLWDVMLATYNHDGTLLSSAQKISGKANYSYGNATPSIASMNIDGKDVYFIHYSGNWEDGKSWASQISVVTQNGIIELSKHLGFSDDWVWFTIIGANPSNNTLIIAGRADGGVLKALVLDATTYKPIGNSIVINSIGDSFPSGITIVNSNEVKLMYHVWDGTQNDAYVATLLQSENGSLTLENEPRRINSDVEGHQDSVSMVFAGAKEISVYASDLGDANKTDIKMETYPLSDTPIIPAPDFCQSLKLELNNKIQNLKEITLNDSCNEISICGNKIPESIDCGGGIDKINFYLTAPTTINFREGVIEVANEVKGRIQNCEMIEIYGNYSNEIILGNNTLAVFGNNQTITYPTPEMDHNVSISNSGLSGLYCTSGMEFNLCEGTLLCY